MLTAEECDRLAEDARTTAERYAAPGFEFIRESWATDAHVYTIAAAALRWYALTETGGDDHAARQALIAACREATR